MDLRTRSLAPPQTDDSAQLLQRDLPRKGDLLREQRRIACAESRKLVRASLAAVPAVSLWWTNIGVGKLRLIE